MVLFPNERLQFGDVPAGGTTSYRVAGNGVFRYAAYERTHIFPQQAIDRLAGALAGYYVLFVENPDLPRGSHRIEVSLTRRSGRVLAKSNYVS